MSNIIMKKSTYETLKNDGYSEKQIKALASMATFNGASEYHGKMDAYSCRPFPSGKCCLCFIDRNKDFDAWEASEVKYEYANKRSFNQILAGVRRKAFKECCPYIRYEKWDKDNRWYLDYGMFKNDIPYSKENYVEFDI